MEREVYEISELEVEKEAKKRKLLFYHDETHISRVVEEILNNWEDQSQHKVFNAILTVAFKHRVLAYYEEFKKQLAERNDIAINEPYPVAVDEFVKYSQEVMQILQDPTAWQALEKDEEAKEIFVKTFKKANSQLNSIQQYYEFAWVDEAFGITEHEWMRYVGAYCNVTRDDNQDDLEDLPVLPLGEAKLAGTQKIDAYYII